MRNHAAMLMVLSPFLLYLVLSPFSPHIVRAWTGTIYIRADGSVDPPTAPIASNGNLYTLTNDVDGSIVVEKDGVTIDGAGKILQGAERTEIGVSLSGRIGVTIRNMIVKTFNYGVYVDSSNQNTITGITLMDNNDGITLANSMTNTVSGNTITSNVLEAVALYDSSGNTISGSTMTGNCDGVYLYYSSNNAISGNTITGSFYAGISMFSSSSNTIFSNEITDNAAGVSTEDSSNNKIFHNRLDNSEQAFPTGSFDTWDDGYPSGGNYWTDHAGVDVWSGPGQNLPGSDGIGDSAYTIDSSNFDRYPLMDPYGSPPPSTHALTITSTPGGTTNPTTGTYNYRVDSIVPATAIPDANYTLDHWELDSANCGVDNSTGVRMNSDHILRAVFAGYMQYAHDVAIASIEFLKTMIGEGYSMRINVSAANQGYYPETFNVTIYANTTLIDSQILTLDNHSSAKIVFVWQTLGFVKGQYIINAYALPVTDEIDVQDNNLTSPTLVTVAIPGDIVPPIGVIDMRDIALVARRFGTTPGDIMWEPNADINDDGKVDMKDIALAARNFGRRDS